MNEFTNLNFQILITFLVTKEAHTVGIINDNNYKKWVQSIYDTTLKTNEDITKVLK